MLLLTVVKSNIERGSSPFLRILSPSLLEPSNSFLNVFTPSPQDSFNQPRANAKQPARPAPTPAPQLRETKPEPSSSSSSNSSSNHNRPVVRTRTTLTRHADTKVPSSTPNQRGSQSTASHRRPVLYVRTRPTAKQADTKVASGSNQSTPTQPQPSLSPGSSLSTSLSAVNSHPSSTGKSGMGSKKNTLEPCDHYRPRRFSRRYVRVDLE